jgi:hypothetical protein
VRADPEKFSKCPELPEISGFSKSSPLKSLLLFFQRGKNLQIYYRNSRFTWKEFETSVWRKPVWRNGRRTGLKILGP